MRTNRAPERGRAAAAAAGALIALILGLLWWQRTGEQAGVASAARTRPARIAPAAAAPARDPVLPDGAGLAVAIDGVVVDERELPVADAAIVVTSHDEVRSGADGRFHVAGLSPGRYYLNAHSDIAAAGPIPLHVEDASLSVVVRLHPGVRLAVEVVSVVDARPLPGAHGSLILSNTIGEAGRLETVADADGILHFPITALGNYHVVAEADGFAPTAQLVTWNDRAGLAWRARIALEPGVVLTGRVVDESGAPVRDAQVTSRSPPRAQTQIPYRPRPPDSLRPPVVTDGDGRFRYPVPAGQGLVLVASHPRYAGGDSGPLTATRPSDVVIRLRAGRALRGRVVDRDRQPIAGATVGDGDLDGAPPHLAYSDADGRFALEGIAPGRHHVTLCAEARGMRASPVLVALPDGLDAPIELIVEHDFHVAGTVVDAAGEPISDAIVHFQHAVPASYRPPTAAPTATLEPLAAGEVRADASGGFVVSGLGPGDVELLARAPGASTGRAAAPVMASVRVRAGDEHVVLALPAPARIRGRVLAAPGRPATELEVSLVQRGGTVRVADSDGRFELADIDPTPGSYRVSVAAAGAAARTLEVRVAPGQTTDLGTITLESGRTLRGRVLDPAGVAVGGAVISVDDASGARIAQSRSDELGGFELAVPNATLTVHATVAGVGSSRFEAVPPGRGAIELHLPETGRLEVTITGSAADGPLTVSAKRIDTADGGFRIFVLDRDPGTSTFHADVSQGDYVVRAASGDDLRAVIGRAAPHEVAVAVAVGQVQQLAMTVERPVSSRP